MCRQGVTQGIFVLHFDTMFGRLLLVFILVPLIELFLFLKIGALIGIEATIATVIVTGFAGAWLTKRQGLRKLARFQAATAEGRLPHEELLEGLLILLAGAVLLTPGFLTDVCGFLLLAPPVRRIVRQALARYLKRKVTVVGMGSGVGGGPGAGPGTARRRGDDAIEVEVVE